MLGSYFKTFGYEAALGLTRTVDSRSYKMKIRPGPDVLLLLIPCTMQSAERILTRYPCAKRRDTTWNQLFAMKI